MRSRGFAADQRHHSCCRPRVFAPGIGGSRRGRRSSLLTPEVLSRRVVGTDRVGLAAMEIHFLEVGPVYLAA
jgi:hypothetical protein